MSRLARYKAALAGLLLAVPGLAAAEKVAGAVIPDGCRLLEPYRYRLDRSYEDALKFFKAVYPPARYPRQPIANQPGLRGVHIENPEARPGGWDGLNVYEIQGEARVFVLVAARRPDSRRGR